jgi:uncharacterized protein YgiM (DUF1202 family)
MRQHTLALGIFTVFSLTTPLIAQDTSLPKVNVGSFNAFTGKISKSKVRMRIAPTLDAAIVRELTKGELFIIVGETDEFYAVQPPSDIKGYIFRTFVLDNKVEGNRVNIRLSPNTEAPVIAQMNSGESVDGTISPLNNKWLEITPPSSTRFYIAKEYVEKAGDQHYMATITKRRDEVNRLLQSTYVISQQELQKPFPEIQIDPLLASYQKITKDFADFPEQAARAKELQEELQDSYLHKKISYLESKASTIQETTRVATVEPIGFPTVVIPIQDPIDRITFWGEQEKRHFEEWAKSNEGTESDFYSHEKKDATTLTGVVQPYSRAIKNKPGDYVLINEETNLPIAFIYSTKINLQEYVGKEVKVLGASRPNNHFAYPAYFVISIE